MPSDECPGSDPSNQRLTLGIYQVNITASNDISIEIRIIVQVPYPLTQRATKGRCTIELDHVRYLMSSLWKVSCSEGAFSMDAKPLSEGANDILAWLAWSALPHNPSFLQL